MDTTDDWQYVLQQHVRRTLALCAARIIVLISARTDSAVVFFRPQSKSKLWNVPV
jgi:hypothetical protein